MDKMIYAYIDEYGAYGFDFTKLGTSHLFIVVAVLVKEEHIQEVDSALKSIRKKHFSGSEIKSQNVRGNHQRRVRILNDLCGLPFQIAALVVDKREVFADHGITKGKKIFYKFLNQKMYELLRNTFPTINIVADEVGKNEFLTEFAAYVKKHRQPLSLFDTEYYQMVNSKSVNAIQIADFMAGTLSYIYDEERKETVPEEIDYLKIIQKHISNIVFFPKTYDESLFEHEVESDNYNQTIAQLSYRLASSFIQKNYKSDDPDVRMQVFVLEYLRFRFKYNPLRRYIPTKELINALKNANYSISSEHKFRNSIIGKLRDSGVIISSSPNGYKLPMSKKEIVDYYTHVSSVVLPMIQRLVLCDNALAMESNPDLKLLNDDNFKGLATLCNAFKENNHI